jgi:tripartite ATP-independent transporter DctP family solute receptor
MGKRPALLLCVLTALVLSIPAPAPAGAPYPKLELKFAFGGPVDHQYSGAIRMLAEKLKEKTGGSITATVAGDWQLGGERDMLEAVQLGTLDAVATASGPAGGFVREVLAVDFPYLFRDSEHAYKALDGPVGTSILDRFTAKNMIGVAWLENGWRQLTNSARPIKSPADLKGLKIRTMENEIHVAYFRALGATAVPMPSPELYNALQQRVVDGQENPWTNIWTFKWYEVQKHGSATAHLYSPGLLVMSKKAWDKLPPDIQQYIKELRPQLSKVSRDWVRNKDADMVSQLTAKGMTLALDIDKAPFIKAADPVYERFGEKVGKDLLQQLRDVK